MHRKLTECYGKFGMETTNSLPELRFNQRITLMSKQLFDFAVQTHKQEIIELQNS